MSTNAIVPTEYEECVAFVDWLRIKNIPHHQCASESQSSSKSAMIRGAKLKRMGQSRGYWDYDVYIPVRGILGDIDCYELVKIEMKRKKGGVVSAEQKVWKKIYELAGIQCKICKGASEAIEFVEKLVEKNNM